MSDGFDKEAEREKLREKLADDEEKREHTQQMSELLLKGATMTNRHCDNCGDPIFRYDGREFCPTCGNEAGGAAGGSADEAGGAADDAAADAAAETPTDADAVAEGAVDDAVADNGPVDPGAATPADTAGQAQPDPSVEGSDSGATEASEAGSSPSTAASFRQSGPQQSPSPQRSESQRPAPSRSVDDAEGVGAARASLTRTLTRFARAAEETDDPRRARDHLEAAREAAEALAALD